MKPILDFSKEVYQWKMRKYPGLNDQTIISIPRSGLVQMLILQIIKEKLPQSPLLEIFLKEKNY